MKTDQTQQSLDQKATHTFQYREEARSDVFDIAVIRCNRCQIEVHTVQKGSSDHNPVLSLIGDPETEPKDHSFVIRKTKGN